MSNKRKKLFRKSQNFCNGKPITKICIYRLFKDFLQLHGYFIKSSLNLAYLLQASLAKVEVQKANLADSDAVFKAKQKLANTKTLFINASKEYLSLILFSLTIQLHNCPWTKAIGIALVCIPIITTDN